MHPGKVLTQARSCADISADILWQSLAERRPADRCLASTLRQQRHIGSRDRRLLSETVFACLRWWGWLHPLAPRRFLTAMADGDAGGAPSRRPSIDPWEWSPVLAAAHILEGTRSFPAVRLWAERASWTTVMPETSGADRSLTARRRILAQLMPNATTPAIKNLLPLWVPDEIHCPRPYLELLEWQQRRPPIWLRVQTDAVDTLHDELSAEGLQVDRHETLHQALRLHQARVNLRALPAFRRGAFEIQDLASQVIGLVCDPKAGERWWDACAGAGGKTLHLADLMQHKGSIVASDRRIYKLRDLRLRARRAGVPNIRTREWKGKVLPKHKNGFHGVLVDAPCTCSGTWRRNPDARWTTTAHDIDDAIALQCRLLANAAGAVKPGGALVYATCSLFERENSGVVKTFLAQDKRFALAPFANPFDGVGTDGTLQVWPWDGDCDAMFVARFRRDR